MPPKIIYYWAPSKPPTITVKMFNLSIDIKSKVMLISHKLAKQCNQKEIRIFIVTKLKILHVSCRKDILPVLSYPKGTYQVVRLHIPNPRQVE